MVNSIHTGSFKFYTSPPQNGSCVFIRNSSLIFEIEKKGVINKQDNVRPVNKNFVKVNNFWNHDGFNHLIEHLIAALDKYYESRLKGASIS